MGKDSPAPPPAPDPTKLVNAQSQANAQAIQASAKANAVNIYGPYGNTTYQKDKNGMPISQTTTLNPQDQAALDQQRDIRGDLLGNAQQAVGWLPQDQFNLNGIGFDPSQVDTSQLQTFNPAAYTPQTMQAQNYQAQQFGGPQGNAPQQLDGQNYQLQQQQAPGAAPQSANIWGTGEGEANLPYDPRTRGDVSAINQQAADSVYNAGKARLDPQFQQQQDQMMQMLADRGIPIDSAAAQTVMSNMAMNQSDAFGRLANDSYMAGHQVAGDTLSREQSLRQDALGEQALNRDWQNQDFMRDYNISTDVLDRNNQTTQQQLANDSAIWGMGNDAYTRDFNMDLQTNQQQNANLGQQFGFDSAIHDQQNADYMLGFNNQLTTTNQNNQDWLTRLQTEQGLRNQQIQERQMVRNSAINDVSMYMQGAPAITNPQAPNMPAYNQSAVDVMGAHNMAYQGQMNAYNAQQQQNASMWNAVGTMAGTAAGMWMKSSKAVKDTLGGADAFLDRVKALPIRTWRYKEAADLDRGIHIGPWAEEFAKMFGGPADKIHLGDAIFILWRAVQEMAARLDGTAEDDVWAAEAH